MLSELKIFGDVIEKLNNNNIPCMISGSVAMNYYTIPGMTGDVKNLLKEKLDKEYIGHRVNKLRIGDFYQEVTDEIE